MPTSVPILVSLCNSVDLCTLHAVFINMTNGSAPRHPEHREGVLGQAGGLSAEQSKELAQVNVTRHGRLTKESVRAADRQTAFHFKISESKKFLWGWMAS
jgi:hypothetical protein